MRVDQASVFIVLRVSCSEGLARRRVASCCGEERVAAWGEVGASASAACRHDGFHRMYPERPLRCVAEASLSHSNPLLEEAFISDGFALQGGNHILQERTEEWIRPISAAQTVCRLKLVSTFTPIVCPRCCLQREDPEAVGRERKFARRQGPLTPR